MRDLATASPEARTKPCCGGAASAPVLGAAIGVVNGFGVVGLGLPPIVITLATNGILQGIALVYSNGTLQAGLRRALRALVDDAACSVADADHLGLGVVRRWRDYSPWD